MKGNSTFGGKLYRLGDAWDRNERGNKTLY